MRVTPDTLERTIMHIAIDIGHGLVIFCLRFGPASDFGSCYITLAPGTYVYERTDDTIIVCLTVKLLHSLYYSNVKLTERKVDTTSFRSPTRHPQALKERGQRGKICSKDGSP